MYYMVFYSENYMFKTVLFKNTKNGYSKLNTQALDGM